MRPILILLLSLFALTTTAQETFTFTHPWQGKKVAYFGDSITDPNNKASQQKYWYWLQQWLGITPYVYGVSGRQWNDIPRQTDKLFKEHADDVDAIIIFCGTNDYFSDVPLGQWYDEQMDSVAYAHGKSKTIVQRKHRLPCMTDSTLCGRINIALDKLKAVYPTKQIVLLTPIHRAQFYRSDTNWQPTEDYANALGLFIDSYVDVVKEAANVWAVPVIDLNSLSGLYPMAETHGQYFNSEEDRLHPNDNGHKRMAQTLLYQFLTLPVIR